MIDEVLAEAHSWLGECQFNDGEMAEARRNFAASLRHKPKQRRVASLLAATFVPPRMRDQLRKLNAAIKGLRS
jgi:hypothetical protein